MMAGSSVITVPPRAAGFVATTGAVAGKTWRGFVRSRQVVFATIGQGVLFLLVFRYVFGGAIATGRPAYVDFMVPGVLVAATLFAASGAAVGVADDRAQGFADRVLSLPTPRAGLVAGRMLADTASVGLAVLAMLPVAVLVGFRPQWTPGLGGALALLGLYGLAFSALFGALGAAARDTQAAQGFGFLAIPLTFVSSSYVPVDSMPAWLATVAANQPVTHMVDALRSLLHPGVFPPRAGTLLTAVMSATAITVVSLWSSHRRLARR